MLIIEEVNYFMISANVLPAYTQAEGDDFGRLK